MTAPIAPLPLLVPDWPTEIVASHSGSDKLAYALDAELMEHPEWCSTDADYPDWTPGGAR